MEELFTLWLGAVGFYAYASSIQTGDGAGRIGALDLTDVISHSHLLHCPSSSPFNAAPKPGYSRNCAHIGLLNE